MKGQTYSIELLTHKNSSTPQSGQQQQQLQQVCTTSSTNVPISPVLVATARRPSRYHPQRHLVRTDQIVTVAPTAAATPKLAIRRHHLQQAHLYQHQHQQQCNHKHRYSHQHQRHLQRPRVIRASEYKNLRQVVPSLRRQRDVGKVEVVTEAARYIDHLHKTLIERFVLCGIPNSLKDILGTDNANELNSQHIMNLVTNMASKQRQQVLAASTSVVASRTTSTRARATSRNIAPTKRPLFVPNHRSHPHLQAGSIAPHQAEPNATIAPLRTIGKAASRDGGNSASGHCFRKTLPVVLARQSTSLLGDGDQTVADKSTMKMID